MPTKRRRANGDAAPYWSEPHGMWRAQIDVGYKDGKRQRKTVYGKTKQECARKLREARQAKEAGDLTTSTMRVDAWLRYWLDNIAAQHVKPRTVADYRSKAELYLIPILGKHRLHQLTPAHVRDLHRQMREQGRSSTTIMHTHHLLAGALKSAMEEVGLGRNVAKTVPPPGKATSKRTALTADEAIAVLRAAEGGLNPSRWLFALLTGARQGECLGLRWSSVDFDANLIHLAWSLQRVPYAHGCGDTCGRKPDRCPKRILDVRDDLEHDHLDGNLYLLRPKTKSSIRVVPMIAPLRAALEQQRDDPSPNPHGLVWRRPDGRPLDGRADYRAWLDLLAAAGAPKLTLHEARHTAVTLLSALGVDPRTIAAIVGHSSLLTQLAYTHVDHTQTRAALDRLGSMLALEG